MRRSLVKLSGLVKSVTEVGKSCHIYSDHETKKVFKLNMENMEQIMRLKRYLSKVWKIWITDFGCKEQSGRLTGSITVFRAASSQSIKIQFFSPKKLKTHLHF